MLEGKAEAGSRTDLQADCQVDPAAEGGADGSGVESQVLEEFGEGLRQGYPGTLLCYNHAGPHSRQVQPSSLTGQKGFHSQKVCRSLNSTKVSVRRSRPQRFTFSESVCRPRPLVQSSMTL